LNTKKPLNKIIQRLGVENIGFEPMTSTLPTELIPRVGFTKVDKKPYFAKPNRKIS
jgi:hypothetical protein